MLDENIKLYSEYYEKANYKTIYHHPDYLLAEEMAEDYPIYLYVMQMEDNFVVLPSVKRRINDITLFRDLPENYYDLKTPHEYSGVLAYKFDEKNLTLFYKKLEIFCKQNSIIFSFIRFNPYRYENKLAMNFVVEKSNNQVWIDTNQSAGARTASRSKERNIKYSVNHAINNGCFCKKVDKNEINIKIFEDMYSKAMDRLSARSFFYFNNEYFEKLFQEDFSELYFVYNTNMEQVLAAAIVLLEKNSNRAYYHLSCRDASNNISGTMELLISTFSDILEKEGYLCIHLSGGATESLRKFKEKFSDKRVEYYIGYKIFDEERYQYLCKLYCNLYPEMSECKFLPLYRSKE